MTHRTTTLHRGTGPAGVGRIVGTWWTPEHHVAADYARFSRCRDETTPPLGGYDDGVIVTAVLDHSRAVIVDIGRVEYDEHGDGNEASYNDPESMAETAAKYGADIVIHGDYSPRTEWTGMAYYIATDDGAAALTITETAPESHAGQVRAMVAAGADSYDVEDWITANTHDHEHEDLFRVLDECCG